MARPKKHNPLHKTPPSPSPPVYTAMPEEQRKMVELQQKFADVTKAFQELKKKTQTIVPDEYTELINQQYAPSRYYPPPTPVIDLAMRMDKLEKDMTRMMELFWEVEKEVNQLKEQVADINRRVNLIEVPDMLC